MTVTVLRVGPSFAVPAFPSRGAPQDRQNRAVALAATPQAPHVRSSIDPQPSQKRASASFGAPQDAQARGVMSQSGLSARASLSSMAMAAPLAMMRSSSTWRSLAMSN